MRTYLLDTNIWIWIIRRAPRPVSRLAQLDPAQVRLSYFVLGELEVGRNLASRPRQQRSLDELTARLPVNLIDAHVAAKFGEVAAGLRMKGLQIGVNDTWIAAEALRYDQTLVTANVAEFSRVPGLRVENWLE